MYKLSAILLVLAVSSTNAVATTNNIDIIERTNKVTANLKALNIIGLSCHVHLEVSGIEGAQSKDCQKFLHNAKPMLIETKKHCAAIDVWSRSVKTKGKKLNELNEILATMKEAKNACENPDNYDYILPTISLMNSLADMK